MADETFRPRRPIKENEEFVNEENPINIPESDAPAIKIGGAMPPEMIRAMQMAQRAAAGEDLNQEPKTGFKAQKEEVFENIPKQRPKSFEQGISVNDHLNEILASLKNSSNTYEEIILPSRGKFYDGENGPANGIISIRPMTGQEEQILATQRFVKRGQAIDMIFENCIKEKYRPENFLTIDRTYILIYLRIISYTSNYEVEVKCPSCDTKFATTIRLDEMHTEQCPDNFGPVLNDVLPTTKLPFSYRLATGRDEQDIKNYRERRAKNFGDVTDDSLTYRTSLLLLDIDGINLKNEIQTLLKNLPIGDVSYIRNCVNDPPFGVDTNIEIYCSSCLNDFEIDLPLEANFFFPRRKKGSTPQ